MSVSRKKWDLKAVLDESDERADGSERVMERVFWKPGSESSSGQVVNLADRRTATQRG